MKLSTSKTLISHIDVESTLNSGQVFLWEKNDDFWYGVNGNDIIRIDSKTAQVKSRNNQKYDIFRNSDYVEHIIKEISRDKIVKNATKRFPGLRLLRQDPFQCYISFIVSANSNIPNIRQMLTKICRKFGEKSNFDGKEFCMFPTPERLAKASETELLECGLGYRAKFVKNASIQVQNGIIDFDHLKETDYHDAKKSLCQVFGIGNKVADCILLFSLDKLDAFPLDRWMIRVLEKYYADKFGYAAKSLTEKKYHYIHEKVVDYFGSYAGYAQQFLFKMERDLNQKRWL